MHVTHLPFTRKVGSRFPTHSLSPPPSGLSLPPLFFLLGAAPTYAKVARVVTDRFESRLHSPRCLPPPLPRWRASSRGFPKSSDVDIKIPSLDIGRPAVLHSHLPRRRATEYDYGNHLHDSPDTYPNSTTRKDCDVMASFPQVQQDAGHGGGRASTRGASLLGFLPDWSRTGEGVVVVISAVVVFLAAH
ncbi:hypothetical protein C8R44DRAFT_981160 [Mycena epipterygia]|nr:hypothetical protein C8R44DRAFT_981160 [Mycena epipterygia]